MNIIDLIVGAINSVDVRTVKYDDSPALDERINRIRNPLLRYFLILLIILGIIVTVFSVIYIFLNNL